MNKNRSSSSIAVLLIVFLVVVFGGRYFFSHQSDSPVTLEDVKTSEAPKTEEKKTEQPAPTEATATATAVKPQAETCSDTLKAELVAKKQTLVKGQILVTFKPDVVYKEAKDVLSTYGFVVQNEVDSQKSYASLHLITAAVPPGQEISGVCKLRVDANVKYAALDITFGLHQ
jgi:hypothetical protein